MKEWPAVIYDKLPMFYGQIMMQDYLADPQISFAGVADTAAMGDGEGGHQGC